MCLCRSERTSFTNGNLKGSINAGRYTVDYLQCGNLPYLAWEMRITAHLSYRRIRRYSVGRLKRLEACDFSHVRFTVKKMLRFTYHYPARCFGMNMPKSRDIQAKIPLPQAIWNEFWLRYCERSEQQRLRL